MVIYVFSTEKEEILSITFHHFKGKIVRIIEIASFPHEFLIYEGFVRKFKYCKELLSWMANIVMLNYVEYWKETNNFEWKMLNGCFQAINPHKIQIRLKLWKIGTNAAIERLSQRYEHFAFIVEFSLLLLWIVTLSTALILEFVIVILILVELQISFAWK